MIKKPWRVGSTKPPVTFEVLSTHKSWSLSKAWGLRTYSVQSQGLLQRKVKPHRPVSWGLWGGNGAFSWCILTVVSSGKCFLCSNVLDTKQFSLSLENTSNLVVKKQGITDQIIKVTLNGINIHWLSLMAPVNDNPLRCFIMQIKHTQLPHVELKLSSNLLIYSNICHTQWLWPQL